MDAGAIALFLTLFMPFFLMVFVKMKVRGRMLCLIARKDKSLKGELCELRDAFVIWEHRAYDVYPDFVRIFSYPMGWPSFLQEKVPICLYDEEDALPRDWITLLPPKEGSLRLRAALDENWIRKLVQESAVQGGGFKINWRKVLPVGLIILGIGGLVFILVLRSQIAGGK